jgi:hypothetical protein
MKDIRILYETSPYNAHRLSSAFKAVKRRLENIYPELKLELDFCDSGQTLNLLENKRYDFLSIHLGEEPELKTRDDRPVGASTEERPIGVYRRAKAAKIISPKTITIAERSLYVPDVFAGLETSKWFDETSLPIVHIPGYNLLRFLKKYNYVSDVRSLELEEI